MRGLWHGGLLVGILLFSIIPIEVCGQSNAPLQRVLLIETSYSRPSLVMPGRLSLNTDGSVLTLRSQRPIPGTHLISESELSYAGTEVNTVDQARDRRHQAMRLGLRGMDGPLQYGVAYRAAGTAAAQERDQESRLLWMNWQAGPAGLTASAEQRSVNLARDSGRPMETSFHKRLGMDLHLGDWPLLRLAYVQRQQTQGGAGMPSLSRQDIDSVEAAVEYQLRGLAVHAGSQYETPDFFQGISRQQHRVSGKFSPLAGLTVEPEFSLTEEQDRMTNQRAETPAAQLGFAYQLRDRSTVHLHTAYSRTQRGLGLDQNTVSASSQWNWAIQPLALASTSVSLQTMYRSQTDPVHASHGTDDFAATVQVNLTGVSWSDMLFDRGWFTR